MKGIGIHAKEASEVCRWELCKSILKDLASVTGYMAVLGSGYLFLMAALQ
jgi:hypothetical protein